MSHEGLFGKVQALKDQQERIQTKTFTKWINSYLYQLKPPIVIKDLMTEIQSGVLLLKLLEILTKQEFVKDEPRNMQKIHCIQNVKRALDFMEKDKKIKLVNINPSDIVAGKPSIVLGLLWSSILHFQIEEQEEYLLQALGLENDPNAKVKGKAKQVLMAWTQNSLNDKYGLDIKDFGPSWRDGKAFNALVHNINPNLVNMEEMDSKSSRERLENAFDIAENKLGIAKLLDPEDVDMQKPDEKSIMTYVAQFLKTPDNMKPVDEDIIECEDATSQFAANKPLDDLEQIRQFIKKVDDTSENPDARSDYDIFYDLVIEKEETAEKLSNIQDPDEAKLVKEDFNEHENKLHQWRENLDRNIKDKDGADVGNWVNDMERIIQAEILDPNDQKYDQKLEDRIKEFEDLANNRQNIQSKLEKLLKDPPKNVSKKQLQDLQTRLEQLTNKEPMKEEEFKVLKAEQDIRKEKDRLNKELIELNQPIESFEELQRKLEEFNEVSINGNPVENFSDSLDRLINDQKVLCEQNQSVDSKFQKVFGDYLDSSINVYQEENEILPEKFEQVRSQLEFLSSTWKDVNEDEKRVNMFLDEMNRAVDSGDIDKKKSLLNSAPEIAELIDEVTKKIKEDLSPLCSKAASQDLIDKFKKIEGTLNDNKAKLVDSIEVEEQAIVAQQQKAAQNLENDRLKEEQERELTKIADWMEQLEKSVDDKQVSPEQIQKYLEKLEQEKVSAQQMSKGFKPIEYAIKKLRENDGDNAKADKLEKDLKQAQQRFDQINSKMIPDKIQSLKQIDQMYKNIEKGIDNLNSYVEEGDSIKENLTKSNDQNQTNSLLQSEQTFCSKKDEIMDSIQNDKKMLKELEILSENATIKVDLDPLKKKIANSEKNLEDLLDYTTNNLEANLSCQKVCENASQEISHIQQFIGEIEKGTKTDKLNNTAKDSEKNKLENLEDLEKKLEAVEDLIDAAVNQKTNSAPYLSKAEQAKIQHQISELQSTARSLRSTLDKDKASTMSNLDTWDQFQNLSNDLEKVIDANKLATIRGSDSTDSKQANIVLGGGLTEKQQILSDSKKRLAELERHKADVKELHKLSGKIESEDASKTAKDLSEVYEEEIQALQAQITNSEQSIEVHETFQNSMNDFENWISEATKISAKLKSLPDDKENLTEKQRLLEKLAVIKPEAEQKLNLIRLQSESLKKQTDPSSHSDIDKDYSKEFNNFDSIFHDLETDNEALNSTLSAIKSIENDYLDVADEIESLTKQMERNQTNTPETIDGKQKLDKDLQEMTKDMENHRGLIEKLKTQCNEITNENIAGELLIKINDLERKERDISDEIEYRQSKNLKEIEQYNDLEGNINEIEELMFTIEIGLEKCANNSQSPESITKIQDLKSSLPCCKSVLEKIIQKRNDYHVPPKLDELCDKIEESYFNLEEKINEKERDFVLKKEEFEEFDEEKNSLNKWIDDVTGNLGKLQDNNQGMHAGSCAEKEALLNATKELLQNVINREPDLKQLLQKSSNIKFGSSDNSPKKASANVCRKYEKLTEDLMNAVKIAEDDLKLHKTYDNDLLEFNKDLELELNKITSDLNNIPNTKEGLEQKKQIFDRISELETKSKEKIENLEHQKNKTLDHSAPKVQKQIDNQWRETIHKFDKNFTDIKNNEEKFKAKLGSLEKSETEYSTLMEKLETLESQQSELLSQPTSDIDELTKKLEAIQELESQISTVNKQIDGFSRSSSRNTSDFPELRQKSDKLKYYGTSVKENIDKSLKDIDNEHKKLCQLKSAKENFGGWLKNAEKNLEKFERIDESDLGQLKQKQQKLKILQDDIAEHRVYLSRLKKQSTSSTSSSSGEPNLDEDISSGSMTQMSADTIRELENAYKKLSEKCQGYSENFDDIIRQLHQFQTARSTVQSWLETNTQVLLKCSDYTMNQSQMKTKLTMIENLEHDLENVGRAKLAEAEQTAEALLSSTNNSNYQPMNFNTTTQTVEQQLGELHEEWETMSSQLRKLGEQLRGNTARQESYKSQTNKLNQWLDEVERSISVDGSSIIEHGCIQPNNSRSSIDPERAKQILSEMERQRSNFDQLSIISNEVGTPAAQLENSQVKTRFNKLENHLKDIIEHDVKKQEQSGKVREEIEQMEKWVFQMSMKMIGDNNTSSIDDPVNPNNNPIIDQVMDNLRVIGSKEQELNRINQFANNQSLDPELNNNIERLKTNFKSLKENAENKKNNLMESTRKMDGHQKLLNIANGFLDKDYSQWQEWNTKPKLGNNNSDNARIINDLERKLNEVKKDLEKSAQDCDDIRLPGTGTPSRSNTPNLRSSTDPSSRPSSSHLMSYPGRRRSSTETMIQPTPTQMTFSRIDEALKQLSDAKKKTEDNENQIQQYNNERSGLKEAIQGDIEKIQNTLQTIPSPSDMDTFMKNTLSLLKESLEHRKDQVGNLNQKYNDISHGNASSNDPVLSDMRQQVEKELQKLTKVLTRQDKEVEADFPEDEMTETESELIVPKLNLVQASSPNENGQAKENVSSQTLRSTNTQTSDMIVFPNSKDSAKRTSREDKQRKMKDLADTIRDINRDLGRTRSVNSYSPSMTIPSSSRYPSFGSNNHHHSHGLSPPPMLQESVRKNMIPLSSSYDVPCSHDHNNNLPFSPIHTIQFPSASPSLSNRSVTTPKHNLTPTATAKPNEYFIPTKDKWHELDDFLNSSPQLHNLPQNYQLSHPQNPSYNNPENYAPNTMSYASMSNTGRGPSNGDSREFEIDYSKPGNHSQNSSKRSATNKLSPKNRSKVLDNLERVSRDAQELRDLSNQLRNYRS